MIVKSINLQLKNEDPLSTPLLIETDCKHDRPKRNLLYYLLSSDLSSINMT